MARNRHPRVHLFVKPDEVPLVGIVVRVATDLGQPFQIIVPAVRSTAGGHASVGHLVVEDLVQLPTKLEFALGKLEGAAQAIRKSIKRIKQAEKVEKAPTT